MPMHAYICMGHGKLFPKKVIIIVLLHALLLNYIYYIFIDYLVMNIANCQREKRLIGFQDSL